LSLEALKVLLVQLLSKVTDQDRLIAGLREENARLKGVNGRPRIKPSGMENAVSQSIRASGATIGGAGRSHHGSPSRIG
jgi:hypothetical protein